MTANQAYQNGYDARKDAKPISFNPFNTLQSLHTDWENGWLDRRDYEKEPKMKPTYEELVAALDMAHALLEELRDQAWEKAKIEVSSEVDDRFNQIGVLIARAKGEIE